MEHAFWLRSHYTSWKFCFTLGQWATGDGMKMSMTIGAGSTCHLLCFLVVLGIRPHNVHRGYEHTRTGDWSAEMSAYSLGKWATGDGMKMATAIGAGSTCHLLCFIVVLGIRSHYTDSSKSTGGTSRHAQGTDQLKCLLILRQMGDWWRDEDGHGVRRRLSTRMYFMLLCVSSCSQDTLTLHELKCLLIIQARRRLATWTKMG